MISAPIPSLWPGIWEQMVSQIAVVAEIRPNTDSSRLHPVGAALHVAIAEPPTMPVNDPRPWCLRPAALARCAMRAATGLECIAAHLPRERCLYCSQAIGVLLLELGNVLLLTRDVLRQHWAGATESQAAQILPELILLVLELPAGIDHFRGLPRPAQPPHWLRYGGRRRHLRRRQGCWRCGWHHSCRRRYDGRRCDSSGGTGGGTAGCTRVLGKCAVTRGTKILVRRCFSCRGDGQIRSPRARHQSQPPSPWTLAFLSFARPLPVVWRTLLARHRPSSESLIPALRPPHPLSRRLRRGRRMTVCGRHADRAGFRPRSWCSPRKHRTRDRRRAGSRMHAANCQQPHSSHQPCWNS